MELLVPKYGKLSQTTHLTTPDTISLTKVVSDAVNEGCKSIALEISSHALAKYRCDNIDVGIFTNLTHEHLDYHKTTDVDI